MNWLVVAIGWQQDCDLSCCRSILREQTSWSAQDPRYVVVIPQCDDHTAYLLVCLSGWAITLLDTPMSRLQRWHCACWTSRWPSEFFLNVWLRYHGQWLLLRVEEMSAIWTLLTCSTWIMWNQDKLYFPYCSYCLIFRWSTSAHRQSSWSSPYTSDLLEHHQHHVLSRRSCVFIIGVGSGIMITEKCYIKWIIKMFTKRIVL